MIGFGMQVEIPLNQIIDNLDKRLDEVRAGLKKGRTLPALRQATSMERMVQELGAPIEEHLRYRLTGLKTQTEQILKVLEGQFDLVLFPHAYFDKVLAANRADIYVPGKHGYSVVEVTVSETKALADCDLRVRDGGRLSAAELQRAATRVFNVTGGLLSKRGQEPTAPIVGYDVEEALAPIATMKYLRRMRD